MAGLKSKAKYVRSELGRRMKLRLTPEIRFIEDESFERGSRVRITVINACVSGYLYVCIQLQVCVVQFPACPFPYHFFVTLINCRSIIQIRNGWGHGA